MRSTRILTALSCAGLFALAAACGSQPTATTEQALAADGGTITVVADAAVADVVLTDSTTTTDADLGVCTSETVQCEVGDGGACPAGMLECGTDCCSSTQTCNAGVCSNGGGGVLDAAVADAVASPAHSFKPEDGTVVLVTTGHIPHPLQVNVSNAAGATTGWVYNVRIEKLKYPHCIIQPGGTVGWTGSFWATEEQSGAQTVNSGTTGSTYLGAVAWVAAWFPAYNNYRVTVTAASNRPGAALEQCGPSQTISILPACLGGGFMDSPAPLQFTCNTTVEPSPCQNIIDNGEQSCCNNCSTNNFAAYAYYKTLAGNGTCWCNRNAQCSGAGAGQSSQYRWSKAISCCENCSASGAGGFNYSWYGSCSCT